jgi:hypothetical protein
MPLDYGSRNLVAGNNSPYIPLVTDNPAFKVAIIPVDGRFEEKPNAKDDRRQQEEIKIGDTIRGEILSGTAKKGKLVLGKVLQVERAGGEITSYKIITQRGKELEVDPTSAYRLDIHATSNNGDVNTNPPTMFRESRVMLFEEWKQVNNIR